MRLDHGFSAPLAIQEEVSWYAVHSSRDTSDDRSIVGVGKGWHGSICCNMKSCFEKSLAFGHQTIGKTSL